MASTASPTRTPSGICNDGKFGSDRRCNRAARPRRNFASPTAADRIDHICSRQRLFPFQPAQYACGAGTGEPRLRDLAFRSPHLGRGARPAQRLRYSLARLPCRRSCRLGVDIELRPRPSDRSVRSQHGRRGGPRRGRPRVGARKSRRVARRAPRPRRGGPASRQGADAADRRRPGLRGSRPQSPSAALAAMRETPRCRAGRRRICSRSLERWRRWSRRRSAGSPLMFLENGRGAKDRRAPHAILCHSVTKPAERHVSCQCRTSFPTGDARNGNRDGI